MPEYSQSPLVKKLAIKPNMRLTAVNPLDGFRAMLGELPSGTTYHDTLDSEFDWIIVFTTSEAQLDSLIESIKAHLKQTGILWISIPRVKNPNLSRNTLFLSRERYQMEMTANVVVNDDWTAYRYKKATPEELAARKHL